MTRFRSQSGTRVALADADDFEPFGQTPVAAGFEPLGRDDGLAPIPGDPASAGNPPPAGLETEAASVELPADLSQEISGDGLADLPTLPGNDPAGNPFGEPATAGLDELPSLSGDDASDDPFGSGTLPDLDGLPSLEGELPSLDGELPALEPLGENVGEQTSDPFAAQPEEDLPELPSLDADPFDTEDAAPADLSPSLGENSGNDPFATTAEGDPSEMASSSDDPFAPATDDPFAPALEQADGEVAAFETALQEELPPPHPIAGDNLQDAHQALTDLDDIASNPLDSETASLGAPSDLEALQNAAETAAEVIGADIAPDSQIDELPGDMAFAAAAGDGPEQVTALAQTLVDELERSVNGLRESLISEIGDSVAAILEPLVSRIAAEQAIEAFGDDIATSLAHETSGALFQAEVPQHLLGQVREMIEQRALPVEARAGRDDALLLHVETATRAISLPRLQDYCEAL